MFQISLVKYLKREFVVTAILVASLLFSSSFIYAGSYQPLKTLCDGFAQLPVVTQADTCLGLVVKRDATNGLRMPRSLVQTPDGKLLILDMGGWSPKQGKLLLLDYPQKSTELKILRTGLNLPHKILIGPLGKIYFGEANRISRFEWENGEMVNQQVVIDGLPFATEYLHPLKNFTFDRKGNLLVNIGSSSDRCAKKATLTNCIDGTEASIRRYSYDAKTDSYGKTDSDGKNFEIIGRGLRNSMALVVHSSGTILQAENSIDLPDADEPYEELNIIDGDKFYGWPLCYNHHVSLAGGECKAENYQGPWTLLPPHAAPLDMLYYTHAKLPNLHNRLLMSWHGYRIVGNRLVSYEVDTKGRPLLQERAYFWRAPTVPEGKYTKHLFNPQGGFDTVSVTNKATQKDREGDASNYVAQHQEVISQWNEIEGVRPEGAPVGLTQAQDGSLFIVDDRNAAILRLSTGSPYQPQKVLAQKPVTIASVVPPAAVNAVLQQHCASCHNELQQPTNMLLSSAHWLAKQEGKTLMEQKIFEEKLRPMPLNGHLTVQEKKVLFDWFKTL